MKLDSDRNRKNKLFWKYKLIFCRNSSNQILIYKQIWGHELVSNKKNWVKMSWEELSIFRIVLVQCTCSCSAQWTPIQQWVDINFEI